ncbi:MAG: tetrahydrofolate dehydrogenase/cyclohydrolase catalytic domain-containing protein [Clostridiaceae bacterium]|nr:bifunctional 5,10-methylene-tetrahydrofolate dehydrogenase/5,10-methylene-tetrahydrofolate cyclohydrolase [Eubacteriales bacterium]
MKASIIDGAGLAIRYAEGLKARVNALHEKGVRPRLAVILAGDNPASAAYVRLKAKRAAELEIETELCAYDNGVAAETLIGRIRALNADENAHGILVQLPLPAHLDALHVLKHILPEKDVDGLHPLNVGALLRGGEGFIPCTPKGVLALIESTGEAIDGKAACVVGRSNTVGKPAAVLLLRHNATVTICHTETRDLAAATRAADILVSAAGHKALIGADMIKPGAIVIDVGMTKVDGKWYGDVDFEPACEVAGYITPVPGGVGPMTIMMLMENTVEAAEKRLHG